MKQVLLPMVLTGIVLYAVWFAGIVLEFEYPYALDLMRIRHGVSVDGVPVDKIIKSNTNYSGLKLHWHTSSYLDDWCGNHKDLVAVELIDLNGVPQQTLLDLFCYSKSTRVLVPMTRVTAEHFPSLMPPGDSLTDIGILDTGRLTSRSIGIGNFELPAKWFQTIVQRESKENRTTVSTNRP